MSRHTRGRWMREGPRLKSRAPRAPRPREREPLEARGMAPARAAPARRSRTGATRARPARMALVGPARMARARVAPSWAAARGRAAPRTRAEAPTQVATAWAVASVRPRPRRARRREPSRGSSGLSLRGRLEHDTRPLLHSAAPLRRSTDRSREWRVPSQSRTPVTGAGLENIRADMAGSAGTGPGAGGPVRARRPPGVRREPHDRGAPGSTASRGGPRGAARRAQRGAELPGGDSRRETPARRK